jgi:uncharacterized protein DUF5134
MTPAWIFDLLAVVMLLVAAVSAVRLVVARPWRRGSVIIDTDIAHLLMAIAMAGVLTSSLRTLPSSAWEIIFGLMVVWYACRVVLDARANGVRALAGGHCAQHLVHSSAMLYMFPAVTFASGGIAGMAGMSGGSSSLMVRHPTIAFFFTIILIGYSIWDLDQLSGRRYGLASARVSLAQVRAGVPALAGVESATTASFSGPSPAGAVSDPVMESGAHGGPARGSHIVACGEDTIAGGAAAGGPIGEFLLSPAVTVGCRIIMSVVMVFMLLITI